MRNNEKNSFAQFHEHTDFKSLGKISLKDAKIVPFIYATNIIDWKPIDLQTLQKYVDIKVFIIEL